MGRPGWLVLAHLAWRELVYRRAVGAFVGGALLVGGLPVALGAQASAEAAVLLALARRACGVGWSVAGAAAVWLAAGAVARDVGLRVLPSIMVRPVAAWAYLCGRALAHVALYSAFAAIALATSWAVLAGHGARPDAAMLWEAASAWARTTMMAGVAVSLGAITSKAMVLSLFGALWLFDALCRWLPAPLHPVWAALDTLLWALGPVTGPERFGWLAALSCLENLGFAAVVLALSAAVLARRDVPTRD